MIQFKNQEDEKYWPDLHPKLKEIILRMEWFASLWGVGEIIVTSIVRKDGTTHDQKPPYRFIDIRSSNFSEARAQELRQIINYLYPYGLTHEGKPTDTIIALNHADTSPEFTAEHFHVQVKA